MPTNRINDFVHFHLIGAPLKPHWSPVGNLRFPNQGIWLSQDIPTGKISNPNSSSQRILIWVLHINKTITGHLLANSWPIIGQLIHQIMRQFLHLYGKFMEKIWPKILYIKLMVNSRYCRLINELINYVITFSVIH